jgi:hypothetical protein
MYVKMTLDCQRLQSIHPFTFVLSMECWITILSFGVQCSHHNNIWNKIKSGYFLCKSNIPMHHLSVQRPPSYIQSMNRNSPHPQQS